MDDIGLDYIKERSPSSRRTATVHRTVAFRRVRVHIATKKKNHTKWCGFFVVDDIGLEPMTFRTSSGCSSQLS